MKFTPLMGAFVLVVTAGGVLAQQSTQAKTNAPATKLRTLTTSANAGAALPTEEEIQAFVSEYKATETSKESLSIRARLGVQKLKPEQRKKYESNNKVPYQLLVDVIKSSEVKGKRVSAISTDGKCNYAILDEEGKVVKQSSESLIKLCAS